MLSAARLGGAGIGAHRALPAADPRRADTSRGRELAPSSMAGYDATTFGNHEFDAGPEALAKAIAAAKKAGHVPPILAANTHIDGDDPGLSQFKELAQAQLIRSHMLLERGASGSACSA